MAVFDVLLDAVEFGGAIAELEEEPPVFAPVAPPTLTDPVGVLVVAGMPVACAVSAFTCATNLSKGKYNKLLFLLLSTKIFVTLL